MNYSFLVILICALSISPLTLTSQAAEVYVSSCRMYMPKSVKEVISEFAQTLFATLASKKTVVERKEFLTDFPSSPYCNIKYPITEKPPQWNSIKKSIANAAKNKSPEDFVTIQDHILWAIFYGENTLIKKILKLCSQQGCSTELLLKPRSDGSSPLHLAVSIASPSICSELVKYGASPSASCRSQTALQSAEYYVQVVLKALINNFSSSVKVIDLSNTEIVPRELVSSLHKEYYECLTILERALTSEIAKQSLAKEEEEKERKRLKRQRQKATKEAQQQREEDKKEEKKKSLAEEVISQQQEQNLMHQAERERARDLAALVKAEEDRVYDKQLKLIREEEQRKKEIAQAKALSRFHDSDEKRSTSSVSFPSSAKIPSLTAVFLADIEDDPTIPCIDQEITAQEFYIAATRGDCALIKQALIQGIDPNRSDIISGETPLITAVLHNQLNAVKLLAPFSNLNALDRRSGYALHYAIHAVFERENYNPEIFFILYHLSDPATKAAQKLSYIAITHMRAQRKKIAQLEKLVAQKSGTEQ